MYMVESKQKFVRTLALVYFGWFLLSFSVYVYLAQSSTPVDYTSIAFLLASSYNFTLITILGLTISHFVKEETRILTMFVAMLTGVMQLGRGFGFIIKGTLDFYVYIAIISGIIGVDGFIALILYDYLKSK